MSRYVEILGGLIKGVLPDEWRINIKYEGDNKYRFKYMEIFKKGDEEAVDRTLEFGKFIGASIPFKKRIEGDKIILEIDEELPLERMADYLVGEFLPFTEFSKYGFKDIYFLASLGAMLLDQFKKTSHRSKT